MANISVVLADDHAIVREGMRQMLANLPGVDVVAEAENGVQAIAEVKTHQPDLLILDLAMPYIGGLELVEEVGSWSADTRILVFTGITTAGVVNELMAARVAGLIFKSSPTDEISSGLKAVVSGEDFICEQAMALAGKNNPLADLTSRERQVLHQIVCGSSNAEIAELFHISPKTVDNHRTNLMRKLDVHSVGGLVQIALREGLVPPEGQIPVFDS